MLSYIKIIILIIGSGLFHVDDKKEIKIRIINQNVASQPVTKRTFQTLNDEFNKHNNAVAGNDESVPEIIIVVMQEVDIRKTHGIAAYFFQRAILTDKGRTAFIEGYKLVKSFGLFTTKTFIFFKHKFAKLKTCLIKNNTLNHFDILPLKNLVAQKGGTSAVLKCGNFSAQILSMHLPARYLGLLKRVATYEKLHHKLKMSGLFHLQLVIGDLNSRSDFEHHDELTREKFSTLSSTYKNDDGIKKADREKENMGLLIEAVREKLGKQDDGKSLTFNQLRNTKVIKELYKYDQLKICMERGFMFETFKDLKIIGAPSYRINDEKGDRDDKEYHYMRSQTISWPDRILFRTLPGMESIIEEGKLDTFILEEMKTDHATTVTEFKLKLGLLETSKWEPSKRKFILHLQEKKYENDERGEIELLNVFLVKKRKGKFSRDKKMSIWKLEGEDDSDSDEEKTESQFKMKTGEFEIGEYFNVEAKVVRFEIDVKIGSEKDRVVVNIWTGKLNDEQGSSTENSVWKGLGVNEKGHIVFEAELKEEKSS